MNGHRGRDGTEGGNERIEWGCVRSTKAEKRGKKGTGRWAWLELVDARACAAMVSESGSGGSAGVLGGASMTASGCGFGDWARRYAQTDACGGGDESDERYQRYRHHARAGTGEQWYVLCAPLGKAPRGGRAHLCLTRGVLDVGIAKESGQPRQFPTARQSRVKTSVPT
ncbi:hypothetical protein C8J57DRAFT_1228069 [Mycena rebaudengoi]|nr:hypothetical protein C8J57DRAFT_1228069 [Mycena rebaudengoi]